MTGGSGTARVLGFCWLHCWYTVVEAKDMESRGGRKDRLLTDQITGPDLDIDLPAVVVLDTLGHRRLGPAENPQDVLGSGHGHAHCARLKTVRLG
jgi:hypothetical protein